MHIILLVIVLLAVIFLPNMWAQYTFKRYARPRDDIRGSGAELARHLLDRFAMPHVKVEQAGKGEDHYDPNDKAVRLSPNNFGVKSLTAITVAAHEVGHAIQHHNHEPMLTLRARLVGIAHILQKMATAIMFISFILSALARSPLFAALAFIIFIGSIFLETIIHLVTLPVETDASFKKALPILIKGNYIEPKDHNAARRILRAAAFTYVAASLMSILNLATWIRR